MISREEAQDMAQAHAEGWHTPPDGLPREGCPECEDRPLRDYPTHAELVSKPQPLSKAVEESAARNAEAIASKPVTPDTLVTVAMTGEKHVFSIAGAGKAPIRSWANTLSDLTGYRAEFLTEKLVEGLTGHLNMKIATSSGDLCPIRFIIQKA